MADISKITLPNGSEYNVKDATARAQSGVTGVKGNNESSYRTGNVNLTPHVIGAAYGINENLSAFAPEADYRVKIDRLENAFYFGDKRWTVTAVKTDAGGTETTLNATEISRFFDMIETKTSNVPAGGKLVVTIDFANEPNGVFPNYPYGTVCLGFYYNDAPESVSARVYGKHTGTTPYWTNLTCRADPRNTTGRYRWTVTQASMYNMQKLEITIFAKSDTLASLHEISYYLSREDKSHNMPYVSKLRAESLYYNLTAPKFIGPLEGNADTATNASKVNNHTVQTDVPANAVFTDTTYESKSAASGGTAVSLVTTGEKYTWNNKSTVPTNHASTATTYGTGSSSNYGHVKLSASTNSTSAESGGIAATPSAVKSAYDLANTANTTANTALSGVNGGLIYDHTFTISNGVATFTPHVYKAGAEVTTDYAVSCFTWKYRLIDGSEVTLTTKSNRGCDVTISNMGYGGHVVGMFTPA